MADSADPAPDVCGVVDGVLPPNVLLPKSWRHRVAQMLERSPRFREQCRRIAEAPKVRIEVIPDLRLFDVRSRQATTIFHRRAPGLLEVVVTLHPIADPALWLSHEFEHVIEQLENADLELMMRRHGGVWRSGEGVYETARAVQAGRAVREEVREYRQEDRRAD